MDEKGQCQAPERTQPMLPLGLGCVEGAMHDYLRQADENFPADLQLHLLLDNCSPHKHAKVKGWLASHSRFQLHFTPTYASWLNQVERWFGIITQRAIRRGSFRSVKELVQKIDQFVGS